MFKGNPAAVCLLEEERDEEWQQAVAREFNVPVTCCLTRLSESAESLNGSVPKFHIRWFTPVVEIGVCGHATLAASHFLFAYDLVKSNTVEYLFPKGRIFRAKRVPDTQVSASLSSGSGDSFLVELDFPICSTKEYEGAAEIYSTICKSLNVSSVDDIRITSVRDMLFVVLPSGEAVVQVEPDFNEIRKCPGSGIIVTGLASADSGFDLITRCFFPKLGLNEDHVCGRAHCAIAPYWSKKLGKNDFVAFQASPRTGVLNLHLDDKSERLFLLGKAVVVMEGSILV